MKVVSKTFQDWMGEENPALHQSEVECTTARKWGAVDLFDSFEKEGYLKFHKEPNLFSPKCIRICICEGGEGVLAGIYLGRST